MNQPGPRRIFYLRAELECFSAPTLRHARDSEAFLIGHFYVDSPDDIDAGAWAQDYCEQQGFKFKAYISLPTPINEASIQNYEPEHQEAFAVAMRSGHAAVVSVVLGESTAVRERRAERAAEEG